MNKTVFWVIIAVLATILIITVLPLTFYPGRFQGGHMMGGWHMTGFGGGFMWLVIIIFVVLVIYLLAGGVSPEKEKPSEEPLEILKRRYARGELTREEFEEMKKQIQD